MDGGNRKLSYAAPIVVDPQSTAPITVTLKFKNLKDGQTDNTGKDS
jgi:hypothetical protein